MSNRIDQDILHRALQAQFGKVVYYSSVTSAEGTQETLSGDCEALTGWPADKFSGLEGGRLDQLVYPGDAARVRRERDQQLKKTGDFSIQYRLIRPDGSTLWIRDSGTQRINEEAGLVREGLLADITGQRELAQRAGRQEQELENAKALLTAISDGTDAHLMVLDGDAMVFLVNRSWLEYDASRGLPGGTHAHWAGHSLLDLIAESNDPALGGQDLAVRRFR